MKKRTQRGKAAPHRTIRAAGLAQVIRAYERYRAQIAGWPGVLSVGYGLQEQGGKFGYQRKRKNVYAIFVVVAEKLAPELLRQKGIKAFKRSIGGVPIDVVVKKAVAYRETGGGPGNALVDPLVGGAAIEMQKNGSSIEQGTLCLVLFQNGLKRYLTCAHVACGDASHPITGGTILQPPAGRLVGTSELDGRDPQFSPQLDVATIVPSGERASPLVIFGGAAGDWQMDRVAPDVEAILGKTVFKVGFITGETSGRAVRWHPDGLPGHPFNLTNVLEIHADDGFFNEDGDSGAPVFLKRANQLATGVGIVVARNNPQDATGYAHPLFLVFTPNSVGFDPIS